MNFEYVKSMYELVDPYILALSSLLLWFAIVHIMVCPPPFYTLSIVLSGQTPDVGESCYQTNLSIFSY